MTGELCRRPVSQGPVRTTHIIFLPPLFDEVLCFGQSLELVGVQALGGVVGRLARAGEVDLYTVAVGPQIHHLAGELAAVVSSVIPTFRISSATGTPTSACFNTPTICSTENLRFGIFPSTLRVPVYAEILTFALDQF
jgi:hypothetical protein